MRTVAIIACVIAACACKRTSERRGTASAKVQEASDATPTSGPERTKNSATPASGPERTAGSATPAEDKAIDAPTPRAETTPDALERLAMFRTEMRDRLAHLAIVIDELAALPEPDAIENVAVLKNRRDELARRLASVGSLDQMIAHARSIDQLEIDARAVRRHRLLGISAK